MLDSVLRIEYLPYHALLATSVSLLVSLNVCLSVSLFVCSIACKIFTDHINDPGTGSSLCLDDLGIWHSGVGLRLHYLGDV